MTRIKTPPPGVEIRCSGTEEALSLPSCAGWRALPAGPQAMGAGAGSAPWKKCLRLIAPLGDEPCVSGAMTLTRASPVGTPIPESIYNGSDPSFHCAMKRFEDVASVGGCRRPPATWMTRARLPRA